MNYILFHNLLMTLSINIRTRIPLDNYYAEGKIYYSSIRRPAGVLPYTRLVPWVVILLLFSSQVCTYMFHMESGASGILKGSLFLNLEIFKCGL